MISIENIIKKGIYVGQKEIVPPIYDDIRPAIVDGKESENIFILKENDRYGCVRIERTSETENDYQVTAEIALENSSISNFENGVAIVCDLDDAETPRFNMITENLEFFSATDFLSVTRLSQRLFKIQRLTGYGVINCKGDEIVPPIYDDIEYDEVSDKIILQL